MSRFSDTGGKATGVVLQAELDANFKNVQPLNGGPISGRTFIRTIGTRYSRSGGQTGFTARFKPGVPAGTTLTASASIGCDQADPAAFHPVFVTVVNGRK